MDQPSHRPSPFINPASYSRDWVVNYVTAILPNTGFLLLVPANPHRVSLLIGTPQQQSILISTQQGALNADGLRLNCGGDSHVFSLSLSVHGGLVQQDIYVGSANAIAIACNYIETLWIPRGG